MRTHLAPPGEQLFLFEAPTEPITLKPKKKRTLSQAYDDDDLGEIVYRMLQQDLPMDCASSSAEWTEQEVLALHEGLLLHMLHLVKDSRTRPASRQRIMKWLQQNPDPVRNALETPFSFQSCCIAAGVDPETMLENIVNHVKRDRALHARIIETQIDDLGKMAPDAPARKDILDWVFAHSDADGLFSFDRSCTAAALDPETLRKSVAEVATYSYLAAEFNIH